MFPKVQVSNWFENSKKKEKIVAVAFTMYDLNKSETITKDEFKNILQVVRKIKDHQFMSDEARRNGRKLDAFVEVTNSERSEIKDHSPIPDDDRLERIRGASELDCRWVQESTSTKLPLLSKWVINKNQQYLH